MLLVDEKNELNAEDEPEEVVLETVSTQSAVAARRRFGMEGRLFIVEPKSKVARDFGGGRGGVGSTGAASLDSLSLPFRPMILQKPDGLLSTSIASVFCESMSPRPTPSQFSTYSCSSGGEAQHSQPIFRMAIL